MKNPDINSNITKPVTYSRLRIILSSILVSFILWLILNSLVTGLSPAMTPFIQAAMFSHRDIGVAFLVFLSLYFPMHIFAVKGFSLESLKRIVFPVRGILFLIVFYFILLYAWAINPNFSIPILALTFILFETFHRYRHLFKRLFDFFIVLTL
ncbi:MAG: hypothetical protein AB1546_03440, partial [bacterium]